MKFSFDNFQEFLDWNLKRENHIKDLNEQIREMGVEHAKLRDNLYDQNNKLLIENDEYERENAKLVDELSTVEHKIKRLLDNGKVMSEQLDQYEVENEQLKKKLEDLKKIKMSDEVTIPDVLKKSPAATDDE